MSEPAPGGVWRELRAELEEAQVASPALSRLFARVLDQPSLADAVIDRVATRLADDILPADVLADTFRHAIAAVPSIAVGMEADLVAVRRADPACSRLIEPLLYFKGYHTLQAHRLAHSFWMEGDRDLALHLQSRLSVALQTDIHPAARIGRGVFLDHATGLVIGQTCVIEDDVSLFQNVTLGGRSNCPDRHPKLRRGVTVGAGAIVLGNVEIGTGARVGAGSVVLRDVAANETVTGIVTSSARVVVT